MDMVSPPTNTASPQLEPVQVYLPVSRIIAAVVFVVLMARLESELPEGIAIAGKRQLSKWNENTYIVQFKGALFNDNEHYVFVTPHYIYLVRRIGMSSNPDIVAATGLIFDNLLFLR